MQNEFEINQTTIKGGCQSGIKVVTHNSKSDLPLDIFKHCQIVISAAVNYNALQKLTKLSKNKAKVNETQPNYFKTWYVGSFWLNLPVRCRLFVSEFWMTHT